MNKTWKLLALVLALTMVMAFTSSCKNSAAPSESAVSDSGAPGESTAAAPTATVSADKTDLVVGGFTEPASFDPLKEGTNSVNIIGLCVYDKLFTMNDDGSLNMELAKSVEYVGDDGLTLQIVVKSGVLFHNGDELTAEDVLYTIQRMSTSMMYASRVDAADFDNAVADGYTVTIPMKYYDARFLTNLTGELGNIMDKSYVEEVGEDAAGLAPVGTGPYVFDTWTSGESVTLTRNDNYWGTKPDFQTIVYKFFAEDNTRELEFESGTLDLAVVDSSDNITRLENGEVEGSSIYTWLTNKQGNFLMNTSNANSPFCGNKALRQAIAHAIDINAVVQAIGGATMQPATSSMPSSCAAYEEHTYEYDPELAKQYLAEAGYPNGFSFTIMVASNQGNDVKMAEAIKAYLSQVGIDMTIETMDLFTLMGYQMSGEQIAGLVDNTIRGDDYEIFQTFEKGSGNMLGEINDDAFQTLLKSAISERDENTRTAIFQDVQTAIYDNAFYIPIYQNVGAWAYKDYVLNMDADAALAAEKVVDLTQLSFAR